MPRFAVPAVVTALALALVALLVYGVSGTGQDTTLDDAVKRGERPAAPGSGIARPLLDGGGERKLTDFRGKVVVLNFWASWCEPCRAEAPVLRDAHQRLTKAGVGTVLGATYQDTREDSKAFERELRLDFPSVRDLDTDLADEFGTRALPETFVLDREGRVVAVSRGQLDAAFLDRALRQAGA